MQPSKLLNTLIEYYEMMLLGQLTVSLAFCAIAVLIGYVASREWRAKDNSQNRTRVTFACMIIMSVAALFHAGKSIDTYLSYRMFKANPLGYILSHKIEEHSLR